MSDPFNDSASDERIAAAFGVMAASPRHTFRVLTWRPRRMRDWFGWIGRDGESAPECSWQAMDALGLDEPPMAPGQREASPWPLPNVWVGITAEDQATADERIPLLLSVPAAVRWVSYEPALGPMRLREEWTLGAFRRCPIEGLDEDPETGERFDADPCEGCPGWGAECGAVRGEHLDWLVVGGESGPGARPFDLSWARAMVDACEETPVRVFVKQLGAVPVDTGRDGNTPLIAAGYTPRPAPVELRHPKGGDWDEWDEELCVRQWPDAYLAGVR